MKYKRLLIGITGSSSCLIIPSYLRLLKSELGFELKICMTRSACNFVSPNAVMTFSKSAVYTDLESAATKLMAPPHHELVQDIDAFLIMPTTANMLFKLAHGVADELISLCALSTTAPVIVAPAMNETMWLKESVQRNARQLEKDGFWLVPPKEGKALSNSQIGLGELAELSLILKTLKTATSQNIDSQAA